MSSTHALDTAAPGGGSGHGMQQIRRLERRWIRRDTPIWPFVWRGLLPTLGLALLGWYAAAPFAHHEIEAQVREQVRADLNLAGHRWANLHVSGQEVLLTGQEPAAGAGDAALAVAKAAACPSPFGRLTCAVTVLGQFRSPAAVSAAAVGTAAAASAAGDTGATAASAAAPAAATVAAAKGCEQALARLMQRSRILFATGRAEIDPASGPLLDQLAKAAQPCPATLLVEGHTDSTGQAADNQALSQARAEAVRDALVARGLAAERLQAKGFGAERPVADNATAEGRTRNRRIEFKALTDKP